MRRDDLEELASTGRRLVEEGSVREAFGIFLRIREIDPDWDHAYASRDAAQCADELGRFDVARTLYEEALDKDFFYDAYWDEYRAFMTERFTLREALATLVAATVRHAQRASREGMFLLNPAAFQCAVDLAETIGISRSALDAQFQAGLALRSS